MCPLSRAGQPPPAHSYNPLPPPLCAQSFEAQLGQLLQALRDGKGLPEERIAELRAQFTAVRGHMGRAWGLGLVNGFRGWVGRPFRVLIGGSCT